jgi:large conductance mechanosensitive channel
VWYKPLRRANEKRGVGVKNLVQEFKEFVNRGNLVELAIAFVLAAAFGLVVSNIVDGILMPIVAAIFGQPNFDNIGFDLGDTRVQVGLAITAIVNFLIIAAVCFFVVKAYNSMTTPDDEDEAGPTEIELLTEIRDALRDR